MNEMNEHSAAEVRILETGVELGRKMELGDYHEFCMNQEVDS